MKKPKQKLQPEAEQEQPEIIQATPLNQNEQDAFNKFDELFHVHEDNYNAEQDTPLLSLIMNANFTNDKVKIKYLFKKYRDEARDNHGV